MKNKEYIRAAAFITSLLILLVLMFSGFSVFASDNSTFNPCSLYDIGTCWSVDSPEWSDISYRSNFLSPNNSTVTDYNNLIQQDPSITNHTTLNGTVHCDDFSNYIISNDGTFLGDDKSFLAVSTQSQNNKIYLHVPTDFVNTLQASDTFTYIRFQGVFNYPSNTPYAKSALRLIDGEYYLPVGYYSLVCFKTSFAIYPIDGDAANVTSLTGLTQINPNYTPANVETSSNNLYLEDAYFLWTTYDPVNDNLIGDNFNVDNIYNSFVTFNYQLTDYQKEHLSEFTINVKASISYSMKFTGQSDYKNWSGSYLYEAPLSQFNTGSLKYNFTDIFNSTGFTSYFNNNYQGEIDFSNSSFKLTMDAELVDNKGGTSSDYIDIFDFLNNKVRNQSKAITNNNNPYVPTDSGDPIQSNAQVPTVQTGDGVLPTGNNGVTSTGSGTVNVVQNNNTGLVNPKPVTDMVKNELLPNENDTNFVGMLAEQTHEDGFVSLMSTTFGFVPVTVWTSLSHYFNIFLTMLVAFFALRLILDIL